MLEGVSSTALFGPDPVGETQCVEKGKPYFAGCPALLIMRIGTGLDGRKMSRPYFALYIPEKGFNDTIEIAR